MLGGNCPNCSALINWVEVQPVKGKMNGRETWNCFLHKCPSCNTILSVQINPIEIGQEIIYGIGEKIKEIQPKSQKIPLNLLNQQQG